MKKDKLTNRILFFSPSVQAGWQPEPHKLDFKSYEQIGIGSFGTVYKAINKKNGKIYAIKQIKKSTLDSRKLLQHAKTQVKIMYQLNHPNIIKLYNHFEDEVFISLVLQYAQKGQLYKVLKSQADKKVSEQTAARYIYQIAQGIKYLHGKSIMHRDLKLQNILVDQKNNIKIADFGWSQYLDQEKRTTYCGTLDYLAPEMIEKGHKHDQRVDIWSIGVLIYQLCTGYSPFSCMLSNNQISIQNVKKNIINVVYKIPSSLTPQCQDIIKNILKKSPQQRISIQQILTHAWIIKNIQKKEQDGYKFDNWVQKLSNQMKQMFPQPQNNQNNNNFFSNQQIYKYTRPDSIIDLKPKKKIIYKTNGADKKIQNQETTNKFSPYNSQTNTSNPNSVNQNQNFQPKFQKSNISVSPQNISQLQTRIAQLQIQHKNDVQQITKLRTQIQKNNKQYQTQIKQLMDQIMKQNKIMQQLNNKLVESQRKVLYYQKLRKE